MLITYHLRSRLIQKFNLCADNIWNDQSLELDSDLPPGWRTIRDSTGTYYWHVPTGTTQWQHPSYSAEEEQNSINGITASQIKVRYSDLCMCVCVCVYVIVCMFSSAVTSLYSWFSQTAADGRRESKGRLTESPLPSLSERWGDHTCAEDKIGPIDRNVVPG